MNDLITVICVFLVLCIVAVCFVIGYLSSLYDKVSDLSSAISLGKRPSELFGWSLGGIPCSNEIEGVKKDISMLEDYLNIERETIHEETKTIYKKKENKKCK